MTSTTQRPNQDILEEGSTAAGGLLAQPPTPEQVTEFEAAMSEANERFLATALAEDGMPVSAGWRGPEVQAAPVHPVGQSHTPVASSIASASN